MLVLLTGSGWLIFGLILVPVIVAGYLFMSAKDRVDPVLESLNAVASEYSDNPRFHNLVESLSLEVGVIEPECYVIEDNAVNGLALKEDRRNVVVLTTGALETFGLAQAEGFIAELMVRLANGSADDSTFAYSLFGLRFVDSGSPEFLKRYAQWATGVIIGDDDRELLADRQAVLLTSYPPGLTAALNKALDGGFVPKSATKGNDYLWVVPPTTDSAAMTPKAAKAGLGLRVDVLASDI